MNSTRTPEAKKLTRGIGLLLPVLRAMERGEWHPDQFDLFMLEALRKAIKSIR